MARPLAVVAYVAFLAAFIHFIGFCGGVVVPKTVDAGPNHGIAVAVAVDLALVLFFGVVHSLMAREGWKRRWTRIIPPAAERSFYVLVASAQMALLMWQWRPLAEPIFWRATGALAWLLLGVQMLGWGTVLLSSFLIDHWEMFGVRQAFGREREATLKQPFLYRWVRHPLYLGLLIGLWAPATMTLGHLLLSSFLTVYLLVGVHYEERDMVRRFGDDYRRYQEEVSMLVPLPRR